MAINTSTLRPGFLVSLKTSVAGGVKYNKEEIIRDRMTEEGKRQAKWQTERIIEDPVEHKAASDVRSKARSLLSNVCTNTAFGMLCPESDAAELEGAVREARRITDEFNAEARTCRVYFYVITGRIAQDDVEAVKAINSEVRGLLEEMEEGVRNLDVKQIRDAAGRAKSIGQMLTPDAAARITMAVEAARGAAKKMVAAGEAAAQEVDLKVVRTITEQRTAFLDLDEARAVEAPVAEGRAVDLAPTRPIKAAPASNGVVLDA